MILAALGLCLLLASCSNDLQRFVEPPLATTYKQPIDPTRPDACHSRDDTPAVIETVTDQVAVPEVVDGAGRVLKAARYDTQTRQRIVSNRQEIWFETPCREVWTEDFIASLQRALIAREVLAGPPSGQMDGPTRNAIRTFQVNLGIDSDVLSVAAGKRLGLIPYERSDTLAR